MVKTSLIISVLICFISKQITYSQWIQTDGPYGSTHVSGIIENSDDIFAITSCGLHYIPDLNEKWRLVSTIGAKAYARKGDLLFLSNSYKDIMLLDMSQKNTAPVSMGLGSITINVLKASDTCLFAGAEAGGFIKSIGFTDRWQSYTDGLPIDTIFIPRGGINLVHYVYSIETINDVIFCGTREGVYKANIKTITWTGSNNGLPAERVHLLYASNDTLFAGIDTKIYASHNLGESWTEFHEGSSRVTSICKINEYFYVTSEGGGILRSEDDGSSWKSFNQGLTELNVSTITSIDTLLVCGTAKEGFFYHNGNVWKKYNKGIICSRIRSITTTNSAVITSDENRVYRSADGNSWEDISPEVTYELFGDVASMNDTIFLSVEYDTPYDAPFIVFSPDSGNTWENLVNPVPFVGDDPYRLYCEDGNLYAYEDDKMYHTDNLGVSWTDLSLPFQYCNYIYDFTVFQGVRFALACGYAEMLRLDQNNNWILTSNGLPADRSLDAMAKTSDALYVYVQGTDIYVSRNNGQSWSNATNGLALDWWFGAYAYSDKTIFIAAENGVFYSYDYGQNWHTLNNGLINQRLRSIALLHDTLYVGTMGNGIWKHDLASIPLSFPETKNENSPFRIFPNPASDFVTIAFPENTSSRIQIIDLMGRLVLDKKLAENGMLNLTDVPNGTLVIRLITDKEIFTKKMIVKKR